MLNLADRTKIYLEKKEEIIYLSRYTKYQRLQIMPWYDWVLWHINLCKLFNAESIFMKIVLFQTIQFNMSTQFNCQKRFYFKLFSLVKLF